MKKNDLMPSKPVEAPKFRRKLKNGERQMSRRDSSML
jgi:hypothetical protein